MPPRFGASAGVSSRSRAWHAWARSGSGATYTKCAARGARYADGKSSRPSRARRIYGRSTAAAGKSRPTPTPPARCIPIKASIQLTAFRPWSNGSTTHSRGSIKSNRSKAAAERIGILPIVADAEAGFGGALNVFELMKAIIRAGAAGVHFEDQLSSEKKCGHLGGKVLIPTQQAVSHLARRAPGSRRARRSDASYRTHRCQRGQSGYQRRRRSAIAPFSPANARTKDSSSPGRASRPASRAVSPTHRTPICSGWRRPSRISKRRSDLPMRSTRAFPGSCWPTTARRRSTGRRSSTTATIAAFQELLGAMGYKFQFITLAGFHALNHSFFTLAHDFKRAA